MEEFFSPEKELSDKLITLKMALTTIACVVGAVSFSVNLLILFLMVTVKKLKENSTNDFIVSITSVNLIFGAWFAYLIKFKASQFDSTLLMSNFQHFLPE